MYFQRPGRKCHFQSSLYSQYYALLSVWNARIASSKWMMSALWPPPHALATHILMLGSVEASVEEASWTHSG